ncbi:MAG: preprotein translocase subunit SecY [Firmicutes bacterium]|nr:preprotein translocase subunit SecY [Bacillota bacterium]
MQSLKSLAQAFKVPELRRKIIFTILMMIIFRIGCCIPIPGIDRNVLSDYFGSASGLFSLFDMFSGGSFSNFTIFALSITPYVTASIILQLLTVAIPRLEALAKEGTEGRKKIAQYTRYLTVVLAFVQAIGLTVGLFRGAVIDHSFFSLATIILCLTAGTAFLMWLGEQINEHGIGNGISIIIMAGIVARMPSDIHQTITKVQTGEVSVVSAVIFVVFAIGVVIGIIEIQQGTRKIPVQYAKRVVGRKMYGGQNTHIPLKVNQAGVIPVIFSLSILQFPLTITYFLSQNSSFTQFVSKYLSTSGTPGVWIYSGLNIVLTMFFTFFYTAIIFNPVEVADNMKANGGFIPGIRPGRPTVDYLTRVMNRINFAGAAFLAAIATLPIIIGNFTALELQFGGTSLLIAVGVALDTMKQLESQMIMRNYQGFLN